MTRQEKEEALADLQRIQFQHDCKEDWDDIDWEWDKFLNQAINDYMQQL